MPQETKTENSIEIKTADEAIQLLVKADRKLAKVIEKSIPFRLEISHLQSPFEALAESIVYQQLSGKAAASIFNRLKSLTGESDFPTAAEVLSLPHTSIRAAGLSQAKTLALVDLATKVEAGLIPTTEQMWQMSDEELLSNLTAVRGIGRWTVEMLLIFRLGRMDVMPATDYGVRKGFALTYKLLDLPTPKALLAHAERWRPYRTVGSWYMWRALELAKQGADKLVPPISRADGQLAAKKKSATKRSNKLLAASLATSLVLSLANTSFAQPKNPTASAPVTPSKASLLKVVAQCDQAITDNSSDFKAYVDRAHAFFDLGNYGLAAQDLTWALQLDPTDGRWYIWRAKCYAKQNKDDEAMTDANQALKLLPKSVNALITRGDLYEKQKENDKAIADYTSALAVDSDNEEALLKRAAVYKALSNLAAANRDLSAAIKINPTAATLIARSTLNTSANPQQALQDASQALQLSPNNKDALTLRAAIFGNLDNPQEAVKDLSAALSLNPIDENIMYSRAQAYIRLSRWEDANNDIEDALQIDPNNSNFYLLLAYINYKKGNKALAKENLKRAQFCNPLLSKNIDLNNLTTLTIPVGTKSE